LNDPWGEERQPVEVAVCLLCLMGLGLNVVAIRKGAVSSGVLGTISVLYVPCVFYLAS
jgi:hypothetical protein